MLQYVESFFQDQIVDVQIPMKNLQGWFSEDVIVNKRLGIHEVIMNLHKSLQRGGRFKGIKFLSMYPHESAVSMD